MAFSLTLPTVTCVSGAAGAQVRFRVGANNNPDAISVVYWQLAGPNDYQNSGSYTENTTGELRYFFVVEGLPDGEFKLIGSDQDGNELTRTFTVACGPPPPAPTLSVSHTDAATKGGVGTITATAGGGYGQLVVLLVELGRREPATAGQPVLFENVPIGTQTVRVLDSTTPTPRQAQQSVEIADRDAPGCTDPDALNPAAGATSEDGSCQYAPPVLAPYFAVPLLQSLRFAVRDDGPETLENTLFCEQTRPGQQVRPYFYQLVQAGDVVRVQAHSSYSAVAATIFRHGGAQVGGAVTLKRMLTLDGDADPLAVVLTLDAASGTTQLRLAAGGALPASLLAARRVRLAGGTAGTYRVTRAVPGSVVSLDDYLVLNRPWQPPGGDVSASWPVAGPGYNIYEADLPLDGLPAGVYQVKLRATQAGWPAALAESEPLQLAAQHKNTVVVDFRNADNAYGMAFSTGITPRLRVPGTFFRRKNGGTETTYRETVGRLTLEASTATRLRQLETYGLPDYLHEKLFLACRLDYLLVNDVRCQTDQAYEVSELRAYPLTGGSVLLEQTDWLGAGNGDDVGVDETAPENALALRGGGYLLLRGK